MSQVDNELDVRIEKYKSKEAVDTVKNRHMLHDKISNRIHLRYIFEQKKQNVLFLQNGIICLRIQRFS